MYKYSGYNLKIYFPDKYRPANSPAFLPDKSDVPLFVRSRIFLFCTRVQFVTLPRCPGVNANHPIERNYGNSVRFLAKIPRPNRRATVYFGTQLISVGCILQKKSQLGPANHHAFCRQVPLFYAKCPSKNILQVGRSANILSTHQRFHN